MPEQAPTTFITPAVLARFIEYAKDAPNWSGEPLVGGNVGGDRADKGYIVNMKKAGLVGTYTDQGDAFLYFKAAGKELAKAHGVEVLD